VASFKQHVTGGIVPAVLAAGTGIFVLKVGMTQAAVTFILAMLGAVLPDLDSDTGRPVEILFSYMGILLPIFALGMLYPGGAPNELLLLFVVFGYFVVRYGLSLFFLKATVHRGIVHSIPVAIICAELTYLAFGNSEFKTRLLFACSVFAGYITHLIMDEMWSVDLLGASIKRSFGTALTLKSNSFFMTVLAYSLIIILGLIIFIGS